MSEQNENKAGVVALIFSFIFPLIGIICYFVNRKEVVNASAYLWAALGGFALGFIINLAIASMAQ